VAGSQRLIVMKEAAERNAPPPFLLYKIEIEKIAKSSCKKYDFKL
jgi:hypothetical protein